MLILEFFKILIVFFVFYFIGKIILSLFTGNQRKSSFYQGFINLLIGTISIVTIFAIIKTSFNTVLLGFVLIGMIYLIKERPRLNKTQLNSLFSKNDLKILGIISFIALLFFLIPLFFYYNTPYNNLPHGDYYYYSRLAYSINQTGIESSFYLSHPFFNGTMGSEPYHYFEIWVAIIFSNLFNISYVDAVVVHSNVLFSTILVLSTMAISKEITKNYWGLVVAFVGVFFSGIYIFDFLPQVDTFVEYGSVFFSKYSVVSIFFSLLILMNLKTKKLSLYPILALPVISITLAPTIFIAICIYYFILFLRDKNFNLFFKKLASIFVVAIFIAVFYMTQSSGESSPINFDSIILIHKMMPLKIIQIIVGALVIIFGVYVLYLIPLLPIFKKKEQVKQLIFDNEIKNILLFYLLVLLVSVFIWAVMHPMHDSVQFHIMPAYLFLNLIIITLLIKGFSILPNKPAKIYYYSTFTIIFCIIVIQLPSKAFYRFKKVEQIYSVEYITDVINELSKKDYKKVGVVLHPNIHIKRAGQVNTYWLSHRPPLVPYFPEFTLINLSIDEYVYDNDPILQERARIGSKNSLYIQYIENNKLDIKNIEENRKNYIIDNKIPFLVCKEGTDIPQGLTYKKRFKDEKSGERFYVFD